MIHGNLNICEPEKTKSYFKPGPLFAFLFVSREDVAFSDNFLNVDFPSFLRRVSTSCVFDLAASLLVSLSKGNIKLLYLRSEKACYISYITLQNGDTRGSWEKQ